MGPLEEFKCVVHNMHKLGMHVIMDWVANHTSWDHFWTKKHPDFYELDEDGNFMSPNTEWTDVIHLNYNNPALWDAMIDDMLFWIREADIDGFRCDMAHLVPTLFWNRARLRLDALKPIFMLAESENHDLLEWAFNAIYNWKLLKVMDEVAIGKSFADDFIRIAVNEYKYLPKGSLHLNFTSNHDENTWNGSARERLHKLLEPLTVLTFLLPGAYLIYNGQEAGLSKRLKFFDKDEMVWKKDHMFDLYQKLINFKKLSPEFCSGKHEDCLRAFDLSHARSIAAYKRIHNKHEYLVVANLGNEELSVFPKDEDIAGFKPVFQHKVKISSAKNELSIGAYGYIFLQKSLK